MRVAKRAAVLAALVSCSTAFAQEDAHTPATPAATTPPTTQDLQRRLEEQQKQIDALAEALEKQPPAESAASKLKLGGYGELHYNYLEDNTANTNKQEIDLHRFVLFVGYHFTDAVRFISELEVEHAFVRDTVAGSSGELELEQAYLEFDLPASAKAKAGLFLVPVGILNETHEPTTFYGVERNPVESAIIPSTWWEGGAALAGRFGDSGLSYDLALHSGLRLDPATYLIRSGRQKVSSALADDPAVTARLKFNRGGVEVGVSGQYQDDARQGGDIGTFGDEVSATLVEAHTVLALGPFGARALYARWDLDGAGPKAINRDVQDGYYGEANWKVAETFGFFGRYSAWDNGGVPAAPLTATEIRQTNAGFNFWPIPQVVLKADAQWQSGARNEDGFNLGVGYHF